MIFAAGLIIGGVFYWQHLRGIWPAVQKPPRDITELLPPPLPDMQENEDGVLLPGENITDMPLSLPPGFSISIFAKGLGGPRVIVHAPDGGLLVSIPSEGKVVRVHDTDGDSIAESITTVASGLDRPHGLAWKCGDAGWPCTLYIAETDKVATYDYRDGKAVNKKKIIDLPGGGGHFTRTIMFLPYPDHEKLLISVGSSCNVCNESDWRRAKVLVANADGSDLKEYVRGLRNAVFMAIHPVTGKVWATEMGRDLIGDNIPPDEINILEKGENYGWPVCFGKNVHDTFFDKNTYIRNPCMEPFETGSYIDLQAHSAPLGLAFFPEEGWPQEYWHNLLVAYHGSWNRSEPTGYKIMRFKLDAQGNYVGEENFISGWLVKDGLPSEALAKEGALGRPVDILIQPGGIMYISDDKAGVIYRVAYRGKQKLEDKSDLIRVTNIKQNDVVRSPLTVKGEARGNWYFEASFPVKLYDANGVELAVVPAQAEGEWMTTEFVPFEASFTFPPPATDAGTLVLEKDNPSGLPEYADQLVIPVRFR